MSWKILIKSVENNRIVRLLSIIAVILSALLTIGSFIKSSKEYLFSNVFIASNIEAKISNLFAGQSISYFRQQLGSELIQRNVTEEYTEYVFKYKTAYIQALSNNKSNEVVYWAVTYCGRTPVRITRPVFSHAYTCVGNCKSEKQYKPIFNKEILLNKSTIAQFLGTEKGDFSYFVSGATANSYAYESVFLGNPSDYLTIIVGNNDICASSKDIYTYLDLFDSSEEMIKEYRGKARINTYGETSPFQGNIILDLLNSKNSTDEARVYFTFGVDRVSVRYFK